MSEHSGIYLGLAALELSLQNTLTLAEKGNISPASAENLLERIAHQVERVEQELGVALMPQFDGIFLTIRQMASMAWKSND